MLKIIAIKLPDGFIISDNVQNKNTFNSQLGPLQFDGNNPIQTFKSDWFKVKSKPNIISKTVTQPSINQRYELKPEYSDVQVKKVWLKKDTYAPHTDELTAEFENLRGLYEYKEDKQPNINIEIEFEWVELCEIEVFKEPDKIQYKAINPFKHDLFNMITNKDLEYNILSQILTPPILLHTQPCKLSIKNTYDIIRAYVKENINPKVAEIASDYDFCFKVVKKIPIAKPYTRTCSNTYAKRKNPVLSTVLVDTKSVQIFEMTHDKASNGNSTGGYQGYTIIKPFEADSSDALKEYIDSYLNELIAIINEPVTECSTCNGVGVLCHNKSLK
jgi:hypothetical protein